MFLLVNFIFYILSLHNSIFSNLYKSSSIFREISSLKKKKLKMDICQHNRHDHWQQYQWQQYQQQHSTLQTCGKCNKPSTNTELFLDEQNKEMYLCNNCCTTSKFCKLCICVLDEKKGYCKYCYGTIKKMYWSRKRAGINFILFLKTIGICCDVSCRGSSTNGIFTRTDFALGELVPGTKSLYLCPTHLERYYAAIFCRQCCLECRSNDVGLNGSCVIHDEMCENCYKFIRLGEKLCSDCKCCFVFCPKLKLDDYETCISHTKKCKTCSAFFPYYEPYDRCYRCLKNFHPENPIDTCVQHQTTRTCVDCNKVVEYKGAYEGRTFLCFQCINWRRRQKKR